MKVFAIMVLLLVVLQSILISCMEPPKPIMPKVVVVEELKEMNRGKFDPDLYLITTERESIDMSHNRSDFIRLKPGDTIKITYTNYGYINNIELLNKK